MTDLGKTQYGRIVLAHQLRQEISEFDCYGQKIRAKIAKTLFAVLSSDMKETNQNWLAQCAKNIKSLECNQDTELFTEILETLKHFESADIEGIKTALDNLPS